MKTSYVEITRKVDGMSVKSGEGPDSILQYIAFTFTYKIQMSIIIFSMAQESELLAAKVE